MVRVAELFCQGESGRGIIDPRLQRYTDIAVQEAGRGLLWSPRRGRGGCGVSGHDYVTDCGGGLIWVFEVFMNSDSTTSGQILLMAVFYQRVSIDVG